MMFLLLLLTFGLVAVVSMVTYQECVFRGKTVPGPTLSVFRWLQDSERWHDYGHFMLEFIVTFMIGLFSLMGLAMLAGVKLSPGPLTMYISALGFVTNCPVLFAFTLSIPSVLLALGLEIIGDGHWRSFVGKPDDTRDFLFDVFTHVTGAFSASLLLAALNIAIVKIVPLIIALKFLGAL